MPRVFNPGHRPTQPLYPDDLVYTTVAMVEAFLQLPEQKPTLLAADTSVSSGSIRIPVKNEDYRRWGFSSGDVVTIYDDVDALGSDVTLTGVESSGASAIINLLAVDPSTAYTKVNNAYVQPQSIITNSKQRGITKSQVENIIRRRQDYIDRITRQAWRPRIVVDEYKNFTTFKPYRRRYYTDYVGAVYLNHRSIQRVLRMGVWQGDNYRELASSRVKLLVQNIHQLTGTPKIFLCPNIAHTAILTSGTTTSTWAKDFGPKSVATEIANVINQDAQTGKTPIQIGTMTENGKALNVSHEFLATANSDEGDGQIHISSMRSTDEGNQTTIAFTTSNCFVSSLGSDVNANVQTTGSSFAVDDGSNFVEGHGLYYYDGTSGALHVARCSRSGDTITIQDDLTSSFQSNLTNVTVLKQIKLQSDSIDEQRQKDWWAMEDEGAILFNNQYPFFENHSLKISYVYGERYLDKAIEDACTKMTAIDVMLTDDYSALFPEGTQNIDLNAKIQKLEEEVKRMLIPYQEGIIVAGMGG